MQPFYLYLIMRFLKIGIVIFYVFIGIPCRAQALSGRVFYRKDPLWYAGIKIFQNDSLIAVTLTDTNGHYSIDNLNSERYDMIVSYPGCLDVNRQLNVKSSKKTTKNFKMKSYTVY